MATAELITDLAGLERIRAGWDALAVELGRPFSSPSWTLAWWRRAAPEGAELRVVAVLSGEAPGALVDRADVTVEGPTGALEFLRRLL